MDSDLRNMLIVCGIVIGAAILVALVSYLVTEGDRDDRPGWAVEMAGQIDEKGGRIYYYGDATAGTWSGATPIYRIDVAAEDEVYADGNGVVIRTPNYVRQVPYERLYGIYVTGA